MLDDGENFSDWVGLACAAVLAPLVINRSITYDEVPSSFLPESTLLAVFPLSLVLLTSDHH